MGASDWLLSVITPKRSTFALHQGRLKLIYAQERGKNLPNLSNIAKC